jgi:hypothetical protein
VIRRLNPDTDLDLYRQCWGWYEALPRWARAVLAVYSVSTFGEYLELARGPRANIGVFDGDDFIAMVTVEWAAEGVYEVHFSSERRPPRDVIVEAMINVTRIVFEELGAEVGFSFTPNYDKGIITMLRAIGMRQDGVEKLRSSHRGKVVKWIRSIMTKDDYERNFSPEPNANRIGAVHANDYAGSEYSRHQPAA